MTSQMMQDNPMRRPPLGEIVRELVSLYAFVLCQEGMERRGFDLVS